MQPDRTTKLAQLSFLHHHQPIRIRRLYHLHHKHRLWSTPPTKASLHQVSHPASLDHQTALSTNWTNHRLRDKPRQDQIRQDQLRQDHPPQVQSRQDYPIQVQPRQDHQHRMYPRQDHQHHEQPRQDPRHQVPRQHHQHQVQPRLDQTRQSRKIPDRAQLNRH